MREGGFEPPRPFGHRILSPTRLPGSATLAPVKGSRSVGFQVRRGEPIIAGVKLFAVSALLVLALSASACDRSASPPSPSVVLSATIGSAVLAPVPTGGVAALDVGVTYDAVPMSRFVHMWHRPGGGLGFYFDTRNPFGRQAPMLVTGATNDPADPFVQVLLPMRPNGASGWVRTSDVRLVPQPERIVVDLSSRTLRRYVGDRLVDRFRVGVGTASTPTTAGTFYVWVRVPQADPNGPYGAFALGLSGFSKVLRDWPGGGRLAIHGTTNPANRGEAVSHGCIRVYNPDMLKLSHVSLGTPVIVKS